MHTGHLLLAECCREQAALDEVLFVPAAVSPHKIGSQPVSAEDRVTMLKLAIGGHESFHISTIEIDRGGVSYTVDTLQALTGKMAESEGSAPAAESSSPKVAGQKLFFLMGADSLHDFPSWREPQRICELATPLVVSRPGSPAVDFDLLGPFASKERLDEIRGLAVHMPQMDISSSEIRQRVSEGKSIRFQTPRAVEKFIESNKLYSIDNANS